jgi:hypothetical protein
VSAVRTRPTLSHSDRHDPHGETAGGPGGGRAVGAERDHVDGDQGEGLGARVEPGPAAAAGQPGRQDAETAATPVDSAEAGGESTSGDAGALEVLAQDAAAEVGAR